MRKTKKYFLTLSSISIVPIAFLASSCGNNANNKNSEKEKPTEKISNEEFKKLVKELTQSDFQFKINQPMLSNLAKSQILATDIADNEESVKLTITNDKFKNKIGLKLVKSILIDGSRNLSNTKGQIEFNLEITGANGQKEKKRVIITGLATNPYGADRSGKFEQDPGAALRPNDKTELSNYIFNLDQSQRFDKDNSKYLEVLKRQLENKSMKELRADLASLTDEQIKKFDELAKKFNFDGYVNAALKGFTLPTYNSNGEYDGLSLDQRPETNKGPSWVDSLGKENPFRIDGLARTLPNETYKKAALQTFQVSINNDLPDKPNSVKQTSGTMWLMDYKTEENGKHPTKFYFGTNLHVADALTDQTSSFSVLRLNKDAGIRSTYRLSELDPKIFTRFIFSLDKNLKDQKGFRTIFDGRDFLNSKPSDFLNKIQKEKAEFKDIEEFVDFAVFEVDFEKIFKHENNKKMADSAGDLAKLVTNDYANQKDNQVKFKKESYLKNYGQIDVPLAKRNGEDKKMDPKFDQLYAVGYPSSVNDYFLKQYIDDDQITAKSWNYSLWINSNSEYYDMLTSEEGSQANYDEELLNRGDFLSYQIGYRSFINRPGVLDSFISAPKNGNNWYTAADGKKYINMGLEYLPKHFAPGGGASGSSIRTQHNELVGVYHVSNNSAKTGLAAAFRSEGYDYGELFGNKYKLPQYDLIYGKGKDQKNSYREAMKKLYGTEANFKTALFSNGFEESQIPSEYAFGDYVKDNN